jgi:hypothetical protein
VTAGLETVSSARLLKEIGIKLRNCGIDTTPAILAERARDVAAREAAKQGLDARGHATVMRSARTSLPEQGPYISQIPAHSMLTPLDDSASALTAILLVMERAKLARGPGHFKLQWLMFPRTVVSALNDVKTMATFAIPAMHYMCVHG